MISLATVEDCGFVVEFAAGAELISAMSVGISSIELEGRFPCVSVALGAIAVPATDVSFGDESDPLHATSTSAKRLTTITTAFSKFEPHN